eukprot:6186089-Pleurochrysis_carterae.AAC.2
MNVWLRDFIVKATARKRGCYVANCATCGEAERQKQQPASPALRLSPLPSVRQVRACSACSARLLCASSSASTACGRASKQRSRFTAAASRVAAIVATTHSLHECRPVYRRRALVLPSAWESDRSRSLRLRASNSSCHARCVSATALKSSRVSSTASHSCDNIALSDAM